MIRNRSQYTTTDQVSPFSVTLESGYLATPNGERSIFTIEQTTNTTVYAIVEATVTGGNTITVNRIMETTADPMPTFTSGATIYSTPDLGEWSAATGEGRDGILLMGQSNMCGHNGEVEEAGMRGYNATLDSTHPQLLQLRRTDRVTDDHLTFTTDSVAAGNYVLADDPLDHANDFGTGNGAVRAESVGLGVTLGKRYIEGNTRLGNRQVVLLPAAKGSTGLVAGGTTQAAPSGAEFLHAVSLANEFLDDHPDNRIVMMCYQQGETDAFAGGSLSSMQWGNGLLNVINTLRTGGVLNPTVRQPTFTKVPFIIGQVTSVGPDSTTINADIVTIVSTTAHTAQSDYDVTWLKGGQFDLHVDSVGLRIWGNRFYEAYKVALDNHGVLPTVPAQISNLAATQDSTIAFLTWDLLPTQVPVITAYVVQQKLTAAGDGTYVTVATLGTSAVSHNETGLTDGTSYTFRVYATSAAGTGVFNTVEITPITNTLPVAVSNFALADGPSGITISWDALVHDPVVTGYVIQRRIFGAGSFDVGDNTVIANQATTSSLYSAAVEGTTYEFQMYAVNSLGNGTMSSILSQAHSASPTAALSPTLWLQKGIGQSVNGTSMDWLDQSGNANHAFPVTSREVNIVAGGAEFPTGGDGRLQIPTTCKIPQTDWTICMRVKKVTDSVNRTLYGQTAGENRLKVGSTGSKELRITGNSSISDVHNTVGDFFPTDVDVSFGITYNSGTSETKAYDNLGALNSTGTAMAMSASTVTAVFLGAYTSSTSNDFDGTIYDVVMFNSLLSNTDVAAVIGEFV